MLGEFRTESPYVLYDWGTTKWSDPLGNLSRHFGPHLGRRWGLHHHYEAARRWWIPEPLRRTIFCTTSSIFDLWSRPWGVIRLLGLRGIPPPLILWKGSGSTVTTNTICYVPSCSVHQKREHYDFKLVNPVFHRMRR